MTGTRLPYREPGNNFILPKQDSEGAINERCCMQMIWPVYWAKWRPVLKYEKVKTISLKLRDYKVPQG